MLEVRKFADIHLRGAARTKHLQDVWENFESGGYLIDDRARDILGVQPQQPEKKPPRSPTPAKKPAPPPPSKAPTVTEDDDKAVDVALQRFVDQLPKKDALPPTLKGFVLQTSAGSQTPHAARRCIAKLTV